MIGWLLSSRLARALGAAVAFIVAVVTFGAVQRKKGVQIEEAKRIREEAKKREQADEAANDLRGAGRDELNKRLRENDKHW